MDRMLEQFLEVADAGSFAAASSKLLISQPALTYNIKKLEAKMQVRLFERSSRGVRLTTYGEALYRSAHLMRRIYANAIDSIDQLREEREHGISIGTGLFYLDAVFQRLSDNAPQGFSESIDQCQYR